MTIQVEMNEYNRRLTMGRKGDILVDGSTNISRVHCILEINQDHVRLLDVSTNGTYIDGHFLQNGMFCILREGMHSLVLGDYSCNLKIVTG